MYKVSQNHIYYNRPLDPFLPGNYLVIARFSGQLLVLCAVRKRIFVFQKPLISREIGDFAGKIRKMIKNLCKNVQSRQGLFCQIGFQSGLFTMPQKRGIYAKVKYSWNLDYKPEPKNRTGYNLFPKTLPKCDYFPGNLMFNEHRIYCSQSPILALIGQYSSPGRQKSVDTGNSQVIALKTGK